MVSCLTRTRRGAFSVVVISEGSQIAAPIPAYVSVFGTLALPNKGRHSVGRSGRAWAVGPAGQWAGWGQGSGYGGGTGVVPGSQRTPPTFTLIYRY